MLTIIVDNRVTRRKTAHVVVNPAGHVVFSASRIGDVLDWLHNDDVTAFHVENIAGHTYRLSLTAAVPAFIDLSKQVEGLAD